MPPERTTFVSLLKDELERQRVSSAVRDFTAGESIFNQGDPCDGLYAVLEGTVRISALVSQSGKQSHSLKEFEAGDFFGEMAIINNAPRSASATAVTDSRLLLVSRDQVMEMMERSPPLVLALLRAFSQRMRDFTRQFVQEVLESERLSLLGRFTRSIVHDFKSPLSVILMASEAAVSGRLSSEARLQAQRRIEQQVDRLTNMLNELLTVSGGRTSHTPEPTDFAAYFVRVLEQTRDELLSKEVQLDVEDPPSVVLPLNPKRLDHVFFNLFNNAADFMPEGGRIMVRFLQGPEEIIVEIEDTGPGLPPEIAERLFTPFFTHGKKNGTGLGLSICKNIIEDHGGRIWPRSEPGRGAVFCFSLPLATNAAPRATAQ